MDLAQKLEKDPLNPDLHREYGLWLLEENRVDEAMDVFSRGLVYNPFDPVMRFRRGCKYIGREMYVQSASDLKLAALLKPEDWEAWYYFGVESFSTYSSSARFFMVERRLQTY